MSNPAPIPPAYRIYAAVTALAAPIIHRAGTKKLRIVAETASRAKERLGQATIARPDGDLIWFHAVSVGEFQSILTLLERLRATAPKLTLLVTTTTTTSAELAKTRLPKGCIHQFSPLDTPDAVNAFLTHWQPSIAVFVESELWPRQIMTLSAKQIPTALINARLSQKSLKNWRKFPKSARMILSRLDLVLCQTDQTAENLRQLGARDERVHTTGDMKKAAAPLPVNQDQLGKLQAQINARPNWLAASTHVGEDEIIAEAHQQILRNDPKALLVLAPRHPQRGDDIEALLNARNLRVARRSRDNVITPDTQVYLADTLGELGTFFSLSPITFIGGSFVPVGGHNPYEAAHFDCAILHGPLYANFQMAYADMAFNKACLEVDTAQALARQVSALSSEKLRTEFQSAAAKYITSGAKTPEIVENFLRTLL